ncbi:hypothetical protein ABK040_003221 [Willaertia magna]
MESNQSPRRSTRKKTPKHPYSPPTTPSYSNNTNNNNNANNNNQNNNTFPTNVHTINIPTVPPPAIPSSSTNNENYSFQFGTQWSNEELTNFLNGYNLHKNTFQNQQQALFEKIHQEFLPNRSPIMIKSLYELHQRFIDSEDTTIDEKKKLFHNIHIDFITTTLRLPNMTSPNKKNNTTKNRSPARNRFTKSPKNKNLNNINYRTNLEKRKMKIILENPPNEIIEAMENILNSYNNNVNNNTISNEILSVPFSPISVGGTSNNSGNNLLGSPSTNNNNLTNIKEGIENDKKYEKNKRLPIKLRKKGTHGINMLLESKNIHIINNNGLISASNATDSETSELIDNVQQLANKMIKFLLRKKTRLFCTCEWFYSTLDSGYFNKNEFIECLKAIEPTLNEKTIFKRFEMKSIKNQMFSKFGKPRRFSQKFLSEEREKLEKYRKFVRDYYSSHFTSMKEDNDEDDNQLFMLDNDINMVDINMQQYYDNIPSLLRPNDQVLVLNEESQYVQLGIILECNTLDHTYLVKMLNTNIEKIVKDIDCMSLGTIHSIQLNNIIHNKPMIMNTPPQTQMHAQNHMGLNDSFQSTGLGSPLWNSMFCDNDEVLIQTPTKKLKMNDQISSSFSPYFQSPKTPPHSNLNSSLVVANNNVTNNNSSNAVLLQQQQQILQPTIITNEDIKRELSECMVLLRKKQTILSELTKLNDVCRSYIYKNDFTFLTKEFCVKYTTILLQLRELNTELEKVMNLLRKCLISTPIYQTTNYPIHNVLDKSIMEQFKVSVEKPNRLQHGDIFEKNRQNAQQVVDLIIYQMSTQLPELNLQNSSQYKNRISECIALLLHLRACINFKSEEDIDLTLEAGLMPFKDSEGYELLKDCVSYLKQVIVGETMMPQQLQHQ